MKLAAAASDLLLLAVELQKGASVELPDGPAFRERVKARLQSFEADAQRLGFGKADCDDARYALVAAVDELIHFSGFGAKLGWDIHPLQAELFGERTAGVRFFERLENVRKRSREVLEVYYQCLAIGFRGRYRMSPASEIDRLLEQLALELGQERGVLSPRGVPSSPPAPPPRPFPWHIAGGIALGASIVLWGVLFFLSNAARGEAVAAISVFGR